MTQSIPLIAALFTLAAPMSAHAFDGLGPMSTAASDPAAFEVPDDWQPPPPPEDPPIDAYFWEKVELPDTYCGNGSQYKFFVSRSWTSNNLLVVMEPGGACWDYPSCTGQSGIMGAANINGIPDDHMIVWGVHSPMMWRFGALNPFRDWNMVFIPYCTGDIHAGNSITTYSDPTGQGDDVEFYHWGRNNVQAVTEWIDNEFPRRIPKMMVAGCSAGGTGSQVNYYYLRDQLKQVEKGYLLNDSGPIFPDSYWSAPLHETIYDAWNLGSILRNFDPSYGLEEDLGNINSMLAETFPEDRLAITYFQRDFNYSRYSYERFWDYPSKDEMHQMWWDDTELLMSQYDEHENMGYYIPYWRDFNSSHCAMVAHWTGTEIEEQDIRLDDYINHLLNDRTPLRSYLESPQEGEDE